MERQFLWVFHNGLNYFITPKAVLHPIPVIVVLPKHIRQCPKRNIETSQEQPLFHFVCATHKIRHHSTWRKCENLLFAFAVADFETNSPQPHSFHFFGSTFIMQAVPTHNFFWK